MTGRDRLVVVSIIALVILGAGWFKVVSPERAKISTLDSKVESARGQVQTAQSELSKGRSAQAKYAEAYASVVKLGRAVPAVQEVPGLLYEIDHASNSKGVELASIAPGASNGAQTGGPPGSKSTHVSGTSFEAMPFTFTFNGSFADLYHLASTVQNYATSTPTGELKVSGRLLTIQGFKLAPAQSAATGETPATAGATNKVPGEHLTGTVTASAYVLPPGSTVSGGGSASGPTGGSGSGATPASGGSSGGGSSAPATIKAPPQ
jgi:hypothetical protein